MRSQNHLAPISFTLALLLSQLGFSPVVSAIPNDFSARRGGQRQADKPYPDTPPPANGRRSPGGSLGPESVCPVTPQPLTAITPLNAHGKTISDQPTFWFYTPYTAADVAQGEFSLLSRNEQTEVYGASFKLPDQPGLISITLPAEAAAELEEGAYYHWYLNLECASETDSQNYLSINGWVQPVATTPELQEQIDSLSSAIWYDTADYMVSLLDDSSGEMQLWNDLLEAVDLDELSSAPVVGPVVLIDG